MLAAICLCVTAAARLFVVHVGLKPPLHLLTNVCLCVAAAARSFGPAVVYGDWTHHWIFWVGPFTGAFVAFLVYEFTFRPSQEPVSLPHACPIAICMHVCLRFDVCLSGLYLAGPCMHVCLPFDVCLSGLHLASPSTLCMHVCLPFVVCLSGFTLHRGYSCLLVIQLFPPKQGWSNRLTSRCSSSSVIRPVG